MKKILILSLLTISILVGVQEAKQTNESATTDNLYSTYGIKGDPGGGGI
ncbi:hypothetical protein KYJ26_08890 [Bacillus sp. MCCB 382]|nr:hypothetical protein [Bacillus sp. MCCB 382]